MMRETLSPWLRKSVFARVRGMYLAITKVGFGLVRGRTSLVVTYCRYAESQDVHVYNSGNEKRKLPSLKSVVGYSETDLW